MDILMPQLGETVAEGTVTHWYKRVGDTVHADEALFDIETDKVATEIPCPIAGVLTEVLVPAGTTVKVGTRIAVVRSANEQAGASAAAQPASTSVEIPARSPPASPHPSARLSPIVRRLLAEHGITAASILGTGRDGRITRDDVLAHITGRPAVAAAAPILAATAPAGATAPPASGLVDVVVPLNAIRRRSAAAMAQAWQAVPHVLQAVEADYARIEAARSAKGAAWQAHEGYALTYLPFLAWAVCQALARYDQLNARIDGDRLLVSRRVHLGIAVDLSHDGLVVPVVRDAQDRTLPALAREIHRLVLGARARKSRPDDYAQATYTISNAGAFGTLITAPLVNPPQVAILSTDGVRKRPVVVEAAAGDSIAIRPVGVLAQSFDHRAIDGAYSAAFLRELKRIVETRAWIDDL